MKNFIIRDTERGLLIRDGRMVDWLEPGKHPVWDWLSDVSVEMLNLEVPFSVYRPEVAEVAPSEAWTELSVRQHEVAVIRVDGIAKFGVRAGRYMLWQLRYKVEASVYDLRPLNPDIPRDDWDKIPSDMVRLETVHSYERLLAYEDGEKARVFSRGNFILSKVMRNLSIERIDLRESERQIVGQEVMTADKVTLRLTAILKYRIVDAELAVESVQDLNEALYTEVQMAVRREVAGHRLDHLLEARKEVSESMLAQVKSRVSSWGIEVIAVDVKDIVLPGDMKALLNRVIEAEKQAAAQVILRREETAAVRSQANTAKMLDASPTLRRLKELEAVKEIASSIDQLTLVAGSGDLVDRLVSKQVES